ncbi:MAG: Hpt domain-containing protein, partial [Marinobacter sp.]
MNLDLAFQTFLDESRELLADMERILLELESRPGGVELQNALFRCVHTVKGSAGMFGLDHVVDFTHVVENVLDRLRAGEIQLCQDLANLLLRCRDHISLLVEVPEPAGATDLHPAGQTLLAELQPFQSPDLTEVPVTVGTPPVTGTGALWHIGMRIQPDALRHGMDPLGFIRFLGTLGELVSVRTIESALPGLDQLDPEACYLGFDVELRTPADRTAIEDVFEFAGDLYQIQIQPAGAATELPGTADDAVDPAAGSDLPRADFNAADQPDAERGRRRKTVQHLRIQAEKLDSLINLVGELVIASAAVSLDADRSGDSAARESAANLNLLVEAIRDSSLDLRMVPI